MPTHKPLLTAAIICFFASVISSADYGRYNVESDRQKAQTLVKQLHISEVLGPLAPVALSPFFGLTCLSGTSILCSRGVLPENEFLMGNPALNNGWMFFTFLGLTILTSVPKLTTVTKTFAEITEQLEAYAGIVAYAAVIMTSGAGSAEQNTAVVYSAGVFLFTKQSLLMIAGAINIFVIHSVKYFFELLALICPVPLLDAAFEIANKSFAAALIAVYAFSPAAAMLLNIVLFLICLAIFNWVRRRIKYFQAMVFDPLWLVFVKKLFHKTDEDIAASELRIVQKRIPKAVYAVKVFLKRKFWKMHKKDCCRLIKTSDSLILLKPRLIRQPVVLHFSGSVKIKLETGLLSNTLTIVDTEKDLLCELLFSNAYNSRLDGMRRDRRTIV